MRFSVHGRPRRAASILLATIAILAAEGCERTGTTARSAIGTETTAVCRAEIHPDPDPVAPSPLLLLDDEQDEAAAGPMADNDRCFVCHINYATEPIAANHARQNIGCVRCHGDSDAHIADESWGSGGNGTAPDIMYPRDKVSPACMTCHPREKIDAPHHEPAFATTDARVCTDCHGDHRLSERRCRWR